MNRNTNERIPVFDAHIHIYPEQIAKRAAEALGGFYSIPILGEGTVSDLVEQCKAAGVSGILLLGVATSAAQLNNVNRYLRDCVVYARKNGMEAYRRIPSGRRSDKNRRTDSGTRFVRGENPSGYSTVVFGRSPDR